jgi:hypothetical protein
MRFQCVHLSKKLKVLKNVINVIDQILKRPLNHEGLGFHGSEGTTVIWVMTPCSLQYVCTNMPLASG